MGCFYYFSCNIMMFFFIIIARSDNIKQRELLESKTFTMAYMLLSNKLTENILTNYFHYDKCVVVISDLGMLDSANFNLSLSYILISSNDICLDSNLVEKIAFAIDMCCYGYIIQASDPGCVLKAWSKAQMSYNVLTVQRTNPKLFAIVDDTMSNNTAIDIVDKLFSVPDAELLTNIVVAILNLYKTDWQAILYTNNFYESVSSKNREPKIFLDRWNEVFGFEQDVELYTDKIHDMNGKIVNVAVVDLLPYSQLEPFIGLEALMLEHFCILYNCTIKVVTDDWLWGEIFENGTGNGLLGMVYDGRADFGIAGVYVWASYFRLTEFSTCYLQSGVTLLVPKPEKIGGWLIPFLPFSPAMWSVYILSVGATGITIYLITKATIKYTRFSEEVKRRGMFLTPVDTIFRSLGLSVLQQPSTPLVPHTPIRHLFTAFEILYLVLSTIYAAELASYLTAPQYSKPIETLIELANSGMIWVAEHSGWSYSLLDVDDPVINVILQDFRVVTPEKLNEIAITGKYGLIVERLAGGHYSRREYLTEEIIAQSHIMAEYLYRSPIIVSMRKASPYRQHFNRLMGWLLNSGLLLYWEADVSRVFLSSRMQTALEGARKLNIEDEARALNLIDCLGIFLLYLGGVSISAIVFLAEIFWYKRKTNLR